MHKRLFPILVLLAPLVTAAAEIVPQEMAKTVTIYRDHYGVPHVYGPTDASCVFGYLYAQAEDNFWQIEDSYIRATGRAAEVYGERVLHEDLLVHSLEIERLSRDEYARSSPHLRGMLDAAAQGLNYYLATHPAVKPRLIQKFEPWMMFAFNRYALYVLFLAKGAGIAPDSLLKVAAATQGSNMWAVAPPKSANGHSMLFINPHQPFFGPGQWYEGHLQSGEGWHLSGANFFGSGFPTIGHNEVLGWSHTVNDPDVVDLWLETFDKPGDPLAYRYGSGYRQATAWDVTLRVEGSASPRKFHLKKTHHGAIVGEQGGKQIAVRFAQLAEGGQVQEWYEMGRAKSLDDFKRAMSRVAIPLFNTMYADRAGNIFYLYNGAVPRRATRFDWSKPVDGSDPETEWAGYHRLEELPQVENPKSGFTQNCNSSPFTTTVFDNPDPAKFPPYMVHEPDNARARISRRILFNAEKLTYDDWARAAFDTTVIQAETEIPKIVARWEEIRKTDPARAARLLEPVTLLREWDHVSRNSSVPMNLFTQWYWKTHRTPLSPGVQGERDSVEALEEVVGELSHLYGKWDVAWGDVNRLQRTQSGGEEPFDDSRPSLPIAGGPGDIGIVFNFYARPERNQKRRYGVAGHSFVSVIEFGEKVQARSILVFGEDSNPKSQNHLDQSELYSKKQFKPAYFWSEDVKANAQRQYHPGVN